MEIFDGTTVEMNGMFSVPFLKPGEPIPLDSAVEGFETVEINYAPSESPLEPYFSSHHGWPALSITLQAFARVLGGRMMCEQFTSPSGLVFRARYEGPEIRGI